MQTKKPNPYLPHTSLCFEFWVWIACRVLIIKQQTVSQGFLTKKHLKIKNLVINEQPKMNRKSAIILLIAFLAALTTTETQLTNTANANFAILLPTITIKSDGSVEPETNYTTQSGDVYTLTGDIKAKFTLVIESSNVVIDGYGHVINGSASSSRNPKLGFANNGLRLQDVSNVTVKNLTVTGFMDRQIRIDSCNDCYFIGLNGEFDSYNCNANTFTDCSIGGKLWSSTNNIITKCNVSYINLENSNATILENNFLYQNCVEIYHPEKAVLWDNGSIGNCWSDYLEKYPNASEIGATGVGDKPYVIDADNVDRYPLMVPFQQLPASTPQPTEPTQDTEPFPTAIAAGATGTLVIIAASLGFIHYKRKNRLLR